MSAPFTPGPWWVDDRRKVAANKGGGALQVMAKHRGEGSSSCVATINFWEVPEANARLIAAAPELYEIADAINRVGYGLSREHRIMLREAVAKARGELVSS